MSRFVTVGIIAGLAVSIAGISWWFAAKTVMPSAKPVSTSILTYAGSATGINLEAAIVAVAQRHHLQARSASETSAELVLTQQAAGNAAVIAVPSAGTPVKLTDATIVADKPATWHVVARQTHATVGGTSTTTLANEVAQELTRQIADRNWSLKAIGDIIIGRSVYTKIRQYDALHPFAQFATSLAGADLTVADLENAFSDRHAVIANDGMTFVSPASAAAGLAQSGIDVVNLANNHSYNGGAEGLLDTMQTLDRLGVKYTGAGPTSSAARQPVIVTVKQTRVAILGYSSITGSTAASSDTPGMNYVGMAPWGVLNDTELTAMTNDIHEAKSKADVVLVYYHWGTEYTHDANADQREVAHRAIDAGADVILGTHPHWVQGVEWYNNRLITYNLGNFIFDQEWSAQTKQGALLNLVFDGSRLTTATFEPYTIADYHQPAPATPAAAGQILSDIYSHSWWPTH